MNAKKEHQPNKNKESRIMKGKGTAKLTLYHFYCPSPVPIHHYKVRFGRKYTASDPLREA